MLLSTTGSFVMLLALSSQLFQLTGSALLTSLIFASQWLLPSLLTKQIGRLGSRFEVGQILFVSEVLGALLTVASAVTMGHPTLFAVLAARGLVEVTTKSYRTLALKRHFEGEQLKSAASFFNTSQYLGSGLGGVVGLFLIAKLTLLNVALLDALTYLVAAVLYMGIVSQQKAPGSSPTLPARPQPAATDAASSSAQSQGWHGKPLLLLPLLMLIINAGFFQGFHNVLRVPLPTHLGLGSQGVMTLQIITSLAIFLGAVHASTQLIRFSSFEGYVVQAISAGAAVAMILAVFLKLSWFNFVVYFVFIYLFEVAYTIAMRDLIVQAPQEHMAMITASSTAYQTLTMTAIVVGGGFLADHLGLFPSTLAIGALALLAIVLSTIGTRNLVPTIARVQE
ncbi:MFS transporter [Deinococcus aluminii]